MLTALPSGSSEVWAKQFQASLVAMDKACGNSRRPMNADSSSTLQWQPGMLEQGIRATQDRPQQPPMTTVHPITRPGYLSTGQILVRLQATHLRATPRQRQAVSSARHNPLPLLSTILAWRRRRGDKCLPRRPRRRKMMTCFQPGFLDNESSG